LIQGQNDGIRAKEAKMKKLIKNANIITNGTQGEIRNGFIGIIDDEIEFVGDAALGVPQTAGRKNEWQTLRRRTK